jgi:hypothetical protein
MSRRSRSLNLLEHQQPYLRKTFTFYYISVLGSKHARASHTWHICSKSFNDQVLFIFSQLSFGTAYYWCWLKTWSFINSYDREVPSRIMIFLEEMTASKFRNNMFLFSKIEMPKKFRETFSQQSIFTPE